VDLPQFFGERLPAHLCGRHHGSLDGGYDYQTHGAPGNPSADNVNFAISRNSNNTHWLWSANALSASVIGLKMKEAGGRRLVAGRRP
jgi:hypothetical protein